MNFPISTPNPSPFIYTHDRTQEIGKKRKSTQPILCEKHHQQLKNKIKSKLLYNSEEDLCQVTPEQANKTITQSSKAKGLTFLLNLKEICGNDVEDSKKFPTAKRVLGS